jgi:hypothetical protein
MECHPIDLRTITASHCCICSAALTDAVSVERGMGPVCSAKYYEIEHVITDEMVAHALGVVATSNLDPAVKMTAKHLKSRPREFSNVLVKWASAHYDQKEVVFDVADAVAALGFTALSARLREDRTKIHLRKHPTNPNLLTVHTASSWNFGANMSRVPNARRTQKAGRYHGWEFPATSESVVRIILGHCFPGWWATLLGSVERVMDLGYSEVRKALASLTAPVSPKVEINGDPVAKIIRVSQDGSLEIHTPRWNGDWLDAFKKVVPPRKRRWTGSYWTCAPSYKAEVVKLVEAHYV